MEKVKIEVKVPQTNASVYDMKLSENEKDWFRNNGEYYIATYNTEHDTNYVGYNPVRIKVPNGTMKLTGNNKITTNNTTVTLNDMKQKVPAENVLMLVGCDEVRVEIPEDITIPEITEGTQTVMNQTPLIEESGKYSIAKWKLDNLDEIPEGVDLAKIKGFNEVEVNIPNKLVNMNSELPMGDNDHPNTGTIDTNGTYDITWWKNNSGNVPNKEKYIGFNNVKVNVLPKILSDQVINIPSNNYVLNINNIWNNDHPNDRKDAFNNVTIHYNESGSGGSSDLVNAVIQSNNTLSQTIISQSNNAALQMITLNNQTIFPILDRLVNGFEEVKLYLLQNRLNSSNQYMYSVTNNINGGSLTAPNRLIEIPRVLTSQQVTELNALVGGDAAKIKMVLDSLYIKLLGVDEDGQIRPLIPNNNSNNTKELSPPKENQQNRLFKIDDIEPPKKKMRGDVPKYEISNYKRDYLFSTKNVNDEFSKDFYATYSCNQVIKTEMLEYDTLILEKSDLGTTVQYDIETNFYNTDDNPLVPDDPQVPDGPGHYDLNPLGIRKLNVVVPNKILKTTNTEQTRALATVNFNNTNQGLATISLSDVNFDGFESPVYATITGTNFPNNTINSQVEILSPNGLTISNYNTVNNTNYIGFTSVKPKNDNTYSTSNTAYELTSTTAKNIPIGDNCSGLSNVYVKPKNYTSYSSNNRYSITSNGNGYISIPSNYSGLGTIYYNVNVKKLDFIAPKNSIIFKIVNTSSGTDVGAVNINSFVKHKSSSSFTAANPMYCFIYFDTSNNNRLISVELVEYYTVNTNVTVSIPANCYSYYFTGAGVNNQLRFYFGGKLINVCELNPTPGQMYGCSGSSITSLSDIGLVDYLIGS